MGIRKMLIPFKNFIKGTVISPTQMNDDLAEIEYTFNAMYDDHTALKDNTYTKNEVDNLKTNTYTELAKMIEDVHTDNEQTSVNVYGAMETLTDSEVSDIACGGMLNPNTDGFITDEDIMEILGTKSGYITGIDMCTFDSSSITNIEGGTF